MVIITGPPEAQFKVPIFIVFPSRTQRNRVWMGVQICVMFLSFPAKHRAAGCFQIDIKWELCCFPSLLPESE